MTIQITQQHQAACKGFTHLGTTILVKEGGTYKVAKTLGTVYHTTTGLVIRKAFSKVIR